MASTPTFASTPREGYVQVSTANTARDGTGTAPLLVSAVAAGTLITRILFTATGTTTTGVVRIFESTDGGTTKRLVEEILVPAVTPSTTVAVWQGRSRLATMSQPMVLGASTNNQIYVSTNNAETFNVTFEGFDLT